MFIEIFLKNDENLITYILYSIFMNINSIPQIKNIDSGNFFVLAGPCVIEGEEMAMRIVKDKYFDEEITLDYGDFDEVEFNIYEE